MTTAICINPLCWRSGDDGQTYTVTTESDAYGTYPEDMRCPDCGEEGRLA